MGLPYSRPGDAAFFIAVGIAGAPYLASEYIAQEVDNYYGVYLPDHGP